MNYNSEFMTFEIDTIISESKAMQHFSFSFQFPKSLQVGA